MSPAPLPRFPVEPPPKFSVGDTGRRGALLTHPWFGGRVPRRTSEPPNQKHQWFQPLEVRSGGWWPTQHILSSFSLPPDQPQLPLPSMVARSRWDGAKVSGPTTTFYYYFLFLKLYAISTPCIVIMFFIIARSRVHQIPYDRKYWRGIKFCALVL